MRRLLFAGLSVAAVLLGLLSTAALAVQPAAAATSTNGYCPTAKGVTVVADFTALGGGVEIRCDPTATSSTNGAQALQGAGFTPGGTSQYGLAFICQINSQPVSTCRSTPPASAYWSYWQASNGGSWKYSTLGATSSKVKVGGFEGWAFYKGSGSDQASPPRATPSRPVPVVQPTYKLGPAASATAPHHATKSSSPTSKATTKKTPTPTATSTDPGVVLAIPDGTSTSSDPPQAAGQPSPADPGGGSSPWPFVIGVFVVAAVGGGAWLVVHQRRRAGGI